MRRFLFPVLLMALLGLVLVATERLVAEPKLEPVECTAGECLSEASEIEFEIAVPSPTDEEIVLHEDGRVTWSGYENAEEAAKGFWTILLERYPTWKQEVCAEH